jgi:hypothetical protein
MWSLSFLAYFFFKSLVVQHECFRQEKSKVLIEKHLGVNFIPDHMITWMDNYVTVMNQKPQVEVETHLSTGEIFLGIWKKKKSIGFFFWTSFFIGWFLFFARWNTLLCKKGRYRYSGLFFLVPLMLVRAIPEHLGPCLCTLSVYWACFGLLTVLISFVQHGLAKNPFFREIIKKNLGPTFLNYHCINMRSARAFQQGFSAGSTLLLGGTLYYASPYIGHTLGSGVSGVAVELGGGDGKAHFLELMKRPPFTAPLEGSTLSAPTPPSPPSPPSAPTPPFDPKIHWNKWKR